jgi:hypothetical protein
MSSSSDDIHDAALNVTELGAAGAALAFPPAGLLAVVIGKIERSRARRQAALLAKLAEALGVMPGHVVDQGGHGRLSGE